MVVWSFTFSGCFCCQAKIIDMLRYVVSISFSEKLHELGLAQRRRSLRKKMTSFFVHVDGASLASTN